MLLLLAAWLRLLATAFGGLWSRLAGFLGSGGSGFVGGFGGLKGILTFLINQVVVVVIHCVLVLVHGVGGIGEMEEGILIFTDVNKRSVHPLDDSLDAA